MKFKEWKKAVEQGYEDPCEYQEEARYCEICDIEESKTYFVEETNTCQDCYKEEEEEKQNFINMINKIKKLKK